MYNFEPYLQTVPKLDEFDFKRLHPYVRSSHDAVRCNFSSHILYTNMRADFAPLGDPRGQEVHREQQLADGHHGARLPSH